MKTHNYYLVMSILSVLMILGAPLYIGVSFGNFTAGLAFLFASSIYAMPLAVICIWGYLETKPEATT